jgi:hypothetical protein
MGAVAQLSSSEIDVEPGRPSTLSLQIRNTGTVVDRFSFEALGGGAQWVSFSPETISLFPHASGTANVVVSAPREPATVAGVMPLGIRVTSSEDPDGSVVEEASLRVAPFSAVGAELVPRITRGALRARTHLAVDNRSNCPYVAGVTGSDPRGVLAFAFKPATVTVQPEETVFVRATLRPRKRFWRGPAQILPFTSTLTVAEGEAGPHPAVLPIDGSMTQEPLLPRWLLVALGALVALAALLVLLWFVLLRPQIRSTAREQVSKQLAAAGVGASSSPSGSGNGSKSAGGSGSGGSSAASNGHAVNGSAQASGNGTKTVYTVPAGRTLEVTDLLVENPAGHTGTLVLARNGVALMRWSLANFRDLDYHWITPTVFGAGNRLQIIVSGCPGPCTPGIYYAGSLTGS